MCMMERLNFTKKVFIFAKKLNNCFDYYAFNVKNKVAEIEAIGDIVDEEFKSATNKLRIVRELTWNEVLELCNTGDYNTGYRNTGDWNKADYSTGFFNTKEQPIYLFNKPCSLSRSEIYDIKGIKILNRRYINNQWISENDMTDEEKKANPKYKITGGYLKSVDFKTACKTMWNELSAEEKSEVKKIPNFNEGIFFEITGIDVDKD